jgi:maleate isomerase
MAQGFGYHREVEKQFARVIAESGAESRPMTSAGALIYGLKRMGAKKVSLMAPYVKPLTDKVVAYIESEGIEVIDRICFEISDNLEVGQRDPMRLLEDVKRLNTANVDAVVLSACVQMQSMPALQAAQEQIGVPVTSTSACTVKNMLDLLGLNGPVPGYGAVLG